MKQHWFGEIQFTADSTILTHLHLNLWKKGENFKICGRVYSISVEKEISDQKAENFRKVSIRHYYGQKKKQRWGDESKWGLSLLGM